MTFYTDVIAKSPKFKSLNRVADLDLLEPVTRKAVEAIIAEAKQVYGIQIGAFETYRSAERQTALYNQGASQLKTVGVHHYGLACDLVKKVGSDWSWKGSFHFLQGIAHEQKVIWGGDWGHPDAPHHFVDADHVQRCSVVRQHQLFTGAWYPSDDYDPYDD